MHPVYVKLAAYLAEWHGVIGANVEDTGIILSDGQTDRIGHILYVQRLDKWVKPPHQEKISAPEQPGKAIVNIRTDHQARSQYAYDRRRIFLLKSD